MAFPVNEREHDFPWEIGVFDAHCHPTDTMSAVPEISAMKTRALTIMATRAQDQDLVAGVANDMGLSDDDLNSNTAARVVPSFGWHPWFSHQIYDETMLKIDRTGASEMDAEMKILHYQKVLSPKSEDQEFLNALPDPIPLAKFISQTKKRLETYPYALVGEIGLDKAFRIPQTWFPGERENRDNSLTPGGREGRSLSPYRVAMDHQRKILLAQFRLAGEMQRAVSVHGVQAHGALFDTLKETCKGHERKVLSKREQKRRASVPNNGEESENLSKINNVPTFPPRVCLHSYSGGVDTINQYMHPAIPVKVYVSFSIVINFSSSASSKTEEVIRAIPDDRILIESDMHIAGSQMDNNLKEIAVKVCALKEWKLEDGVEQLKQNWNEFVFGKKS